MFAEVIVRRCFAKKLLPKNSQNLLESICATATYLTHEMSVLPSYIETSKLICSNRPQVFRKKIAPEKFAKLTGNQLYNCHILNP